MKNALRVIPRLDIKGPNLVKGIHLEGLRVLGAPADFAQHYYHEGADELLYMDVVASLYNRNSLGDFVKQISKKIFVPLIVGGGVRSVDDIRELLRSGADKVSLNTAAVKNEDIIRAASRAFGSSTIVVSIEAIRQADGTYGVYTDNGRESSGKEVLAWAQRVEALGAGEILLTSIDREGTGEGYDLELTRAVADRVSIPVVACGGAGSSEDVVRVVREGHADAVSLASVLHYDVAQRLDPARVSTAEGNTQFLKSGRAFTKIKPLTLPDLKAHLAREGLPCREVAR